MRARMGADRSLELMSTHALNYSIPVSRNGETIGRAPRQLAAAIPLAAAAQFRHAGGGLADIGAGEPAFYSEA